MSIHNYDSKSYTLLQLPVHSTSTTTDKNGANASILDGFIEDTNFSIEEIDRLRKRFMKLDKDGSGKLISKNFYPYLVLVRIH